MLKGSYYASLHSLGKTILLDIMKLIYILPFILFSACAVLPTAQEIVDQSIKASGTLKLKDGTATFNFRDKGYTYRMKEGAFEYSRTQKDTARNVIKDVLTNQGLERLINGEVVALDDKKREAYSASINSVIYFAFLPLSLNDAAVIKEYVGKSSIKGAEYHKVKVTFKAEGGGEDFEDVFYYWFDTEDYSMDYLAYSYQEEDGQGVRFREAFNVRNISGAVVQDYRNYKPKQEAEFSLENIDQAFEEEKLTLLSLIELKDVRIE